MRCPKSLRSMASNDNWDKAAICLWTTFMLSPFFFFIDRYYRGEDLPAAGSQKSTEQLCGGRRGGCWKAFLSWRVKRPISFEWGHNQRHSWQVSSCAFFVWKMVLSSAIQQNVWDEIFLDYQWQMQCVQYQRTIDNPRSPVAGTCFQTTREAKQRRRQKNDRFFAHFFAVTARLRRENA